MSVVETRFDQILELLNRGGVRFIVIGGLAAIAHGHARATFDRPKDLEIIAELQALLEERRKRE